MNENPNPLIEERPEVVTPDGEILDASTVRYAYTRQGRWEIGKEYPNPVPLEPPLGFIEQKPLHEQIRDMVAREMSAQAEADGMETAEEADDFEVGDDFDPDSPYELDFEPTAPWPGNQAVIEAEAAAVAARGGGGAEPPSDEQPAAEPPPAKP